MQFESLHSPLPLAVPLCFTDCGCVVLLPWKRSNLKPSKKWLAGKEDRLLIAICSYFQVPSAFPSWGCGFCIIIMSLASHVAFIFLQYLGTIELVACFFFKRSSAKSYVGLSRACPYYVLPSAAPAGSIVTPSAVCVGGGGAWVDERSCSHSISSVSLCFLSLFPSLSYYCSLVWVLLTSRKAVDL